MYKQYARFRLDEFETLSDFINYLTAQYEAGTPVCISYDIDNPYTIQLTPQQIKAISGVNTIYTDADGLTVTAREDMQHRLETITNAIVSLGGNV